jgi:hypothetical protein
VIQCGVRTTETGIGRRRAWMVPAPSSLEEARIRGAGSILEVGGTTPARSPATSESGGARALPCPTVPAPLARMPDDGGGSIVYSTTNNLATFSFAANSLSAACLYAPLFTVHCWDFPYSIIKQSPNLFPFVLTDHSSAHYCVVFHKESLFT